MRTAPHAYGLRRGLYVCRSSGRQLCRYTIDPKARHGMRYPVLSLGLGRRSWRLPLPFVSYRTGQGRLRLVAWRISERFWRWFDAKYRAAWCAR